MKEFCRCRFCGKLLDTQWQVQNGVCSERCWQDIYNEPDIGRSDREETEKGEDEE